MVEPVRLPGEIGYPRVRVTAFFASLPSRAKMYRSSLVVLWFQREPWPVPDDSARAAIEGLDWERLALDFDWMQPRPGAR